jgi:hypothetical protein
MPVYVAQQFEGSPDPEPVAVIPIRQLDRIIERLDDCKPGGWTDLWLAGLGVGATLALGALVVALSLPSSSSGISSVLWALTATGAVVFLLCLVAYFIQRREHNSAVGQVMRDLEIYRPEDGHDRQCGCSRGTPTRGATVEPPGRTER